MGTATQVQIEETSVDMLRLYGERMFEAHAAEAEPNMVDRVQPDWEGYRRLEATGGLITLAAWANDQLVGYAVAAMVHSAHYEGFVFCQHDLLFVDPAWRKQRVGLRLIEELQAEAVKRGAEELVMHAKVGSRLGELLGRLGFAEEETIYKVPTCHKQ